MLTSLKIENVAIIESASIEFGCGLNILTGETGAGKSIIIDSINAVLGERTSKDLIRTGADSAKVFAVFEDIPENVKSLLSENGVDSEDDVLIVNRVINKDGKNVCRINGCPITVNMLKTVARELINIHGQHDNQALLSPERHCSFVDNFGGYTELINEYKVSYDELCDIRRQLSSFKTDEGEKARRIDLLTYQINEIESSTVTVGERQELVDRKNLINNSQRIIKSLSAAYDAIKRDDGGADSLSSALYDTEKAAECYEAVSSIAEQLSNIKYSLDDVAEEIREKLSELDYDEFELDEIESRLDLLYRLSRKYGETEEEILDYLEKAKDELYNISFSDEKIQHLTRKEAVAFEKTTKLAADITAARISAGKKLSDLICHELEFLDMPNVVFVVSRKEVELNDNGADEIEFLISANAGETPKSLAKIASGGELSRIMLAIKNSLADSDNIGTMIFDEIDTGVSGRAAEKIALKLRQVSEGRQVICVTHLAQIAVQGDVHLYISKSVRDGKTYTKIKSLMSDERTHEIARIMGGIEISDLQLQSAAEMLKRAGNI